MYGSLRLHSFRSPISFRPFSSVPFPVGASMRFSSFFLHSSVSNSTANGPECTPCVCVCGFLLLLETTSRCVDHFLLCLCLSSYSSCLFPSHFCIRPPHYHQPFFLVCLWPANKKQNTFYFFFFFFLRYLISYSLRSKKGRRKR